MKLGLISFFFLFLQSVYGQEIICSIKDKDTFTQKMLEIENLKEERTHIGDSLALIGKTFLGTPYVAKTLEVGEKEALVINLQGLDCTTYVENAMAFSLMQKNKEKGFDSFATFLQNIRYRDGQLKGYGSRLHYFTEWISDNEEKGLVKSITSLLGGEEITKQIDFMSTHRELYPFLKDDANYLAVKKAEERLNNTTFCNLPPEKIALNEHLIETGDIIALTTSIKGLDVTHTGIATREADGRIHLLHASSSGQVEISKLPLVDYLKGIKSNIGIMVARPIF